MYLIDLEREAPLYSRNAVGVFFMVYRQLSLLIALYSDSDYDDK